jgi:hypothetical protein
MIAAGALAQDDQFGFMPAGGRSLLFELLGQSDAENLAKILTQSQSAEDWHAWAASQATDLDDKALATFLGYAELNLPVGEDVLQAFTESGDTGLFPPDGKDLAIAQCQFCHSLFSGYLMQDRDEVGWKSTFKSPFHKEIPMTEVEQDTFARYSAINMPLRFEDVPPELRY